MKNGFKMMLSFLFLSIAFSSVDYQSQIQPIFDANCMNCHTGAYNGGLQLGSYDEVMAGGNSGNTVVAGDHASSNLWARINDGSMPPSGSLSTEDINLIAQWIDEGALEEPAVESNPSAIFITEITDPENSSDAGRYVELFNSSDEDIDLSTGWALQRWTNGNTDPQSATALTGIIPANGFYIICNDAGEFSATYGLECSQDIGTGGAADSNGDDNIALLDADGNIADMFGVPGEDGTGTGHEFEDGRAERVETVTQGNPVWDESEWNIDNDSGGGDGNQYAPEGFDPFAWIGGGEVVTPEADVYIVGDMNGWTPGAEGWGMISNNGVGVLTATLTAGDYGYKAVEGSSWDDANYPNADNGHGGNQFVNLTEDGDVTFYVNVDSDLVFHTNPNVVGGFFSAMDGSGDWDPANASGEMVPTENDLEWGWSGVIPAGTHEFKVALNQNWDQNTGDNISLTSDGSSTTNIFYNFGTNGTSYETTAPTYAVTFNVDMSYETIHSDGLLLRGSWHEFSWDGSTVMSDDDGDNVYSVTIDLTAGDYTYKYDNGPWENVPEACGVLNDYGNYDRTLTVVDAALSVDALCWSACEACVGGCTDALANNYNPDANADDGSCDFSIDPPENLVAYINEFHYDNAGGDIDEGVEVVATSGMTVQQLGMIVVTLYNGSNGQAYGSYSLDTFTEGVTVGDLTYYHTFVGSMQNGAPDGLSLSGFDQVFQFISYEGQNGGEGFDAQDGPALGLTSTDVGVAEGSGTAVGTSIQFYHSDGWFAEVASSWGAENPIFCSDEVACNYGEAGECTFAEAGFDCDGNALLDVTFHVNMTEQVVDTEGYGLDIFLPNPYGYHDMTDEDGDGIWTVTLTLSANTDYSYKFKNGEAWEANFNDLGCGDGSEYGNRYFTSGSENMDVGPFCFSSCSDCVEEVVCGTGDTNGDTEVNVTDIVLVVQGILGELTLDEEQLCRADVTEDGVLNVTDIVNIVYIILGDLNNVSFAENIVITKNQNDLNLNANGRVGAIQLTISHEQNAKIELTQNSFMSDLRTENGKTTMIIILPENGQLVNIDSDFEILEMIASDLEGEIEVNIVNEFNLLTNYPNPFNPVTTITYSNEIAGNVSLNIYDLTGRLINTLVSNPMEVGQYNIDWNGTDNNGFDVTSGVYLLTLENETGITTSKITLLR